MGVYPKEKRMCECRTKRVLRCVESDGGKYLHIAAKEIKLTKISRQRVDPTWAIVAALWIIITDWKHVTMKTKRRGCWHGNRGSAPQIEVTFPDWSDTSIVHAVIEENKAFNSPFPLANPVNDYNGSVKVVEVRSRGNLYWALMELTWSRKREKGAQERAMCVETRNKWIMKQLTQIEDTYSLTLHDSVAATAR